jgi:hypothetical protein
MISRQCKEHLREVGENPLRHLWSAVKIAIRLQGYVFACLIHAVIPCLFTHTTTNGIRQILEDRK